MFIKAIRDWLEIFPLIVFMFITKIFSLRTRTMIGGWLMSWVVRTNHKLKSRVIENLDLTMPGKSNTEKKKFIKKLGWFIGATFTELIFNSEFQKSKSRFEHIESELKPLIEANKQGRPIIIVSAHLGCWEAIRAVLKLYNLTSGAIYKKNKNQFYETLHLKAIKSGGEPIFSTGYRGTKKMVKHLKTGGIIAIMLDQAAEDGEFFDFLGVPAKTATSVAKIAIKLDALVVPSYGIRSVKENVIKVHFEAPILNTEYKTMTANLTKSIENRVRANPEQWYWLHRRWKY
jgi:KDO2-lipid IV(A) lauroyltransferase